MWTSMTMPAPEGGTLTVSRELAEVEDAPDVHWAHTDRNGHRHTYTEEQQPTEIRGPTGRRRKDQATHYPTLRWVIDREWTCTADHGLGLSAGDPHQVEEGHWECATCHQRIEPGHGPAQFATGQETWELTETATNPSPEWLAAGHVTGMTYRHNGGPQATRVRHLTPAEGRALMAGWARDDQQRRDHEQAVNVANGLGYPEEFTR